MTSTSKKESSSRLLQLPGHILLDILQYLEIQDLLPLCTTCKVFNSFINENSRLWKNVSFDYLVELSADQFERILVHARGFRTLLLPYSITHNAISRTDFCLVKYLPLAKSLYWLNLSNAPVSTLCFLEHLPAVRHTSSSVFDEHEFGIPALTYVHNQRNGHDISSNKDEIIPNDSDVSSQRAGQNIPVDYCSIGNIFTAEKYECEVTARDSASIVSDEHRLSVSEHFCNTATGLNTNSVQGEIESETYNSTKAVRQTEHVVQVDKGHEEENSPSEHDISEYIDYDDPRDPDWIPRKRKLSSGSSHSEDDEHLPVVEGNTNGDPPQMTAAIIPSEGKQKTSFKENKKRRMQGREYFGKKLKTSGKSGYCVEKGGRLMTPRQCNKRCNIERKSGTGTKCIGIDEDTRGKIFERFWVNMDWGQKKVYVLNHVSKKRNNGIGRKKYTYTYTLTVSDTPITVCKGLFLSTLGLKEDMVYDWIEENGHHGIPSKVSDERQQSSIKSRALECASEFLTKLPKMPSHYCRAETSKEYLETSFSSMIELYQAYKDYCAEGSHPVYGRTRFTELFTSMKLGFFKPKKDQCDICVGHSAGNIDEEEYGQHIRRKVEAANEKASDKLKAQEDPSLKVITMDLQSLLLCPKLNASALYYRTKLCCYNFTLFDLVTRNVMCYFFNETATDLCASSFASCIVDYLGNLDLNVVKEIILYSDGCTYQNRNAILANTLCAFSKETGITVTQKILEKGHTFMEVDSVHATIERKIRKKDMYVPVDYVREIKAARKPNEGRQPYEVKYVDHHFFRDYTVLKAYASIRPGSGVGSPVVTDLRQIRYNPDGRIEYKLNHSDNDFSEIPKPRSNRRIEIQVSLNEVLHLNEQPIRLKKLKYEHLQQIKKVIPTDFHPYYDSLPHHN